MAGDVREVVLARLIAGKYARDLRAEFGLGVNAIHYWVKACGIETRMEYTIEAYRDRQRLLYESYCSGLSNAKGGRQMVCV